MKYAGMHWSNGPESKKLETLPSLTLLMLASEARYHYERMRQAGKTVMWRALPREGKRPAEIGYTQLRRNADEVMNLWDEQPHYGEEWFVPYNELDLNYERGDSQNDFENVRERFQTLSIFLLGMHKVLRERLPDDVKLFFPPWTPDHGDVEHIAIWKKAAEAYDGLVIHAYESPERMLERFNWYTEQFPGKPIFIGEWNSPEPAAFLEALKSLENHPQFAGATYFAWHWFDAPGWWPTHYNVDENEELYKLFKELDMPAFPNYPERPAWTPDQIVKQAITQAGKGKIPPKLLLALLFAESGLKWDSTRFAYRKDGKTTNLSVQAVNAINDKNYDLLNRIIQEINENESTDISFGVGQQTVRWADEGDHVQTVENVMKLRDLYLDVPHAIATASKKIKTYYDKYGDELEALCRYNKPKLAGKDNPVARAHYEKALTAVADLLPKENDMVVSIARPSPNAAATFTTMPKGVILHGSRSGAQGNPKKREAEACANWAVVNPEGLSWHATIGENEYYVHLAPGEWGWNARAASDDYIAVEFAQATVDEPITDAQVDAFVAYMQREILPRWPHLPLVFKTHAEVEASGETGRKDGKTDVFPNNDVRAAELKARIMEKLNVLPAELLYEFHFGFEAKANELGRDVVGDPIMDEEYIGENYSYQFTTTGKMEYSKKANTVKFTPTK